MKILLVADSLAGEHGRPFYVKGLAAQLAAAGHTVSVYCEEAGDSGAPPGTAFLSPQEFMDALPGSGAVHLHLPVSPATALLAAGHPRLVIHPHDYGFCCPAGTLYLPGSSRLCHRQTGLLCYLWAIEEGCTSAAPGPFARRYMDARKLKSLAGLNRARWIASTPRMARALADSGIPEDRIHAAGTAVPAPPEVSEPPANGPVFFAGTVEEKSGIFDLLDIVLVNDVDLHVAGDGPDLEKFRLAVERADLGRKVHLLGDPGWSGRQAEYAKARFVVLPDRWDNSLPWAAAEAAASGRAIVGYQVEGAPAWCRHPETALLADRAYVHELSGAAKLMIAEPDRCRRMGEAARRLYDSELSWPVHLKRIMDVYGRLTA
ncbi:MAG: glycosyltransferase [Deltaproteobacteria bacterium]|nr:glycosyltransferase [Deltaproteobacteria bacterium]